MSRTGKNRRRRTHSVAQAIGVGAVAVALAAAVPLAAGTVPTRPAQLAADRPAVDEVMLGITGELPGEPLPATGAAGSATSAIVASVPAAGTTGTVALAGATSGPLGIPAVMLDAYQRAERTLAAARPGCNLSWTLLAAIGRVESGHASGGRVDATGRTLGAILGPRLDGAPGVAAIADTDGGALDGDTVWDRAVGPMQFIPSTWRTYRADGNGDGVGDPHNVYDAALAAGAYLCAGGDNLADPVGLSAAVFRYNRSVAYVRTVIAWASAYAGGVVPTVSLPGTVPAPTDADGTPPIPPENFAAFLGTSSAGSPSTVGALGCTPMCGTAPAGLVPLPPDPGAPVPALPDAPPPTVAPPTPTPTAPPRGAEGGPTTEEPTTTERPPTTTAPPTTAPPTTAPPTTEEPTTSPTPPPTSTGTSTSAPEPTPTPSPADQQGPTTSETAPPESTVAEADASGATTSSAPDTTPSETPAPETSSSASP